MNKLIALMVVIGILAVTTGCVMTAGPATGWVVTNNVKGPVAVGDTTNVKPAKQGVAEASAIIFFATGDASIQKAMANGGITKVHHVDSETFNILGVYGTYKTVVWGE